MNKFLNNLERKIGKWAIPNLTTLMVGCYVVGYILHMLSPQVFSYMTLEPAYRYITRTNMGDFSL